VSFGGIPSAPYSIDINVTAPLTVPNVVDSVDIITLPSDPQILQNIFSTGGSVPTAFSIAGDEFLTTAGVLLPFTGGYNLGTNAGLQPIVNHYSGDFNTSFGRTSAGIANSLTADALVNQLSSNPSCTGVTPLQCELGANNPAVILISVGYYDALNGTDPTTFGNTLDQIIQTASTSGTIPVLLTVPTTGGLDPATVNAINDEILAAGVEWQVPVLNTGRVLNELPLTASPNGGGYLDDASTYGVNALNLHILQILDSVLDTASPGLVP
jgi:hypothetical protein